MYATRTGLVLGFHGCDKSILQNILSGSDSLRPSKNHYDWLGNGIYFWDNSPTRALEFANDLMAHPERSSSPIKEPAVLGAVLNLGHCLDLLDYENLDFVREAYEMFMSLYTGSPLTPPKNKAGGSKEDLLYRELDCAVLETLHQVRAKGGARQFDSVRGVFWEGKLLYPEAGFREKDHIQICIRNPNCIKGYFRPLEEITSSPPV